MAGCCGNQSNDKKREWVLPTIIIAVMAALIIIGVIQGRSDGAGGNSANGNDAGNSANGNNTDGNNADVAQVIGEGESLVIPVGEISETAQFYPVTVDGTNMEVVAVTAPDGTIRTVFNTCQVCNGSPRAYFAQQGDTLQCLNCGNIFPMSSVEVVAGGCNPVPIFGEDKTVTDESIAVSYETLQANAYRFPSNWKTG